MRRFYTPARVRCAALEQLPEPIAATMERDATAFDGAHCGNRTRRTHNKVTVLYAYTT